MHFPPKPKLFVHRVGRVARNGRSGTAISLVTAEDLPYLTDLFLFLGRPIQFAKETDVYDGWSFYVKYLMTASELVKEVFFRFNN